MKQWPTAPAGATGGRRRRHRSRPLPKWVKNTTQLDEVARSRCLLVLSVLSGELPVSDAIARAKISRGTYYHLETRALHAMLAALNPLSARASDGSTDLSAATQRIEQLETTVQRLEQERRRAQRLLLLTRKTIRVPLASQRRGRPTQAASPSLSVSGQSDSRHSAAKPRPGRASARTPPGASSP